MAPKEDATCDDVSTEIFSYVPHGVRWIRSTDMRHPRVIIRMQCTSFTSTSIYITQWTRIQHVLNTYWTRTQHVLNTYSARTEHVLSTYRTRTEHWTRTRHVLNTYSARTEHVLTRTGHVLNAHVHTTHRRFNLENTHGYRTQHHMIKFVSTVHYLFCNP